VFLETTAAEKWPTTPTMQHAQHDTNKAIHT